MEKIQCTTIYLYYIKMDPLYMYKDIYIPPYHHTTIYCIIPYCIHVFSTVSSYSSVSTKKIKNFCVISLYNPTSRDRILLGGWNNNLYQMIDHCIVCPVCISYLLMSVWMIYKIFFDSSTSTTQELV